jgi:hypothetical protein
MAAGAGIHDTFLSDFIDEKPSLKEPGPIFFSSSWRSLVPNDPAIILFPSPLPRERLNIFPVA